MIESEVTLLPLPDSPTRPMIFARALQVHSLTAWTTPSSV